MKFQSLAHPGRMARSRRRVAFTLIEIMVASSVCVLLAAGAMSFLWFSGLGMSGVTAQALTNQRAGNAIEFIQSRARFAVSVSNDSSGNVLTLGFDDDPATDSDHDGKPYNDKNHYEQFQFIGVNGSRTNSSTNSLIYIPNSTNSARQVLIAAGVRNLPNYQIFTVTNLATTIVRFGVVDGYGLDHFQSIDIQGTAVPLNRAQATNIIAILP
jgi:type II secretory pathway pseudopilin PulG